MSRKVNIIADHVISALGNGSGNNFDKLLNNETGVSLDKAMRYSDNELFLGSIDEDTLARASQKLQLSHDITRFESLCIVSVADALRQTRLDPSSNDTLFVLSTTKGNIDLVDKPHLHNKLDLWYSAKKIASYFNIRTKPRVISIACISGVAAVLYAYWQLKQGNYKHAIVVGADVLSRFVVSGFESFLSLSASVCKPFDSQRDGLNLGEAAATLVLSTAYEGKASIINGATANDANHISGPSRTGEGLFQAIQHTLSGNEQIDFISAHGTATPYNDNMESIAFSRCALDRVPINGFKGYIGHTLGAAGVVELVFSLWSMYNNMLIRTHGFDEPGVEEPINVVNANCTAELNNVLKTASGFGGCNASLLLKKNA